MLHLTFNYRWLVLPITLLFAAPTFSFDSFSLSTNLEYSSSIQLLNFLVEKLNSLHHTLKREQRNSYCLS